MRYEKEQAYLMHSKTESYHAKLAEARKVIKIVLTEFEKPYVAYSGGKDSTAMLHLVLQEDPNIMVIHWDFGSYYIPRQIYQSIIKNAREMGAKHLRTPSSPKYEMLKRKAINVLGEDYLGKYVPSLVKEGFDLAFVGLRASESCRRKIATESFLKPEKGMMSCYPLAKWSYKDVWAYIVSNAVPYLHEFYDLYGALLGDKDTRFCTFFDPEFEQLGSYVDGVLMTDFKNKG